MYKICIERASHGLSDSQPNRKRAIIIQGVQEKLCFFHNSLQPLPHINVRDLQSYQRNASVQSLLLPGNFSYNQ